MYIYASFVNALRKPVIGNIYLSMLYFKCNFSILILHSQADSSPSALDREREAAAKHMKERRLKAKKKREFKQQEELALALKEKEAVEDELLELKLATSTNSDERVNDLFERRLSKMKKKYEKKIAAIKFDLQDAAEVLLV